MNILWQSNSPHVPSGYGVQTALFAPLLATEHKLSLFATYGIEGAPLRWQGMELLPRGVDSWGGDMVAAHCAARRVDLLITLLDVWVLDAATYAQLPWLAWTPVDHEPLPPAVRDALRGARLAVAMSRFGQAMMQAAGIDAAYVPHGVDTRVFHPTDRAAARRAMGWEQGRFVAMMNAANKGDPSRKGFRETLIAWREFTQTEPDALLYLHTEQTGLRGVPLDALVQELGIAPSVQFVDAYRYAAGLIHPSELNTAYNAADVLLNPSMGEGFGVPILEAQAAGCPVIVSDFSAMPELCFAGWRVGGRRWMTYQNAYMLLPDPAQITTALHSAKTAQDDAALRQRASHAAQAYAAPRVYADYWQPLLAEIMARGVRTKHW